MTGERVHRFEIAPTSSVPTPVLAVVDATLKACERILEIPAPPLVWVRPSENWPLGRFDWSSNGHHRILIAVPSDVTLRSLAVVMAVILHEFKHYHQAVSGWSMSEHEQPAQERDADAFMEKIMEALVQFLQNEDPTATFAEIKGMIR